MQINFLKLFSINFLLLIVVLNLINGAGSTSIKKQHKRNIQTSPYLDKSDSTGKTKLTTTRADRTKKLHEKTGKFRSAVRQPTTKVVKPAKPSTTATESASYLDNKSGSIDFEPTTKPQPQQPQSQQQFQPQPQPQPQQQSQYGQQQPQQQSQYGQSQPQPQQQPQQQPQFGQQQSQFGQSQPQPQQQPQQQSQFGQSQPQSQQQSQFGQQPQQQIQSGQQTTPLPTSPQTAGNVGSCSSLLASCGNLAASKCPPGLQSMLQNSGVNKMFQNCINMYNKCGSGGSQYDIMGGTTLSDCYHLLGACNCGAMYNNFHGQAAQCAALMGQCASPVANTIMQSGYQVNDMYDSILAGCSSQPAQAADLLSGSIWESGDSSPYDDCIDMMAAGGASMNDYMTTPNQCADLISFCKNQALLNQATSGHAGQCATLLSSCGLNGLLNPHLKNTLYNCPGQDMYSGFDSASGCLPLPIGGTQALTNQLCQSLFGSCGVSGMSGGASPYADSTGVTVNQCMNLLNQCNNMGMGSQTLVSQSLLDDCQSLAGYCKSLSNPMAGAGSFYGNVSPSQCQNFMNSCNSMGSLYGQQAITAASFPQLAQGLCTGAYASCKRHCTNSCPQKCCQLI